MSAASTSFSSGNYVNPWILFYYDGEDGFKVGITGTATSQWVIFDNFRLEYFGSSEVSPIFVSGLTDTYATSSLEGKQIVIKNDGKISLTGVTLDFTDVSEMDLFSVAGISVDGTALADGADLSSIFTIADATVKYVLVLSDGKVVAQSGTPVIDDGVYYAQYGSTSTYMSAGLVNGLQGIVDGTGMELQLTVTEGMSGVTIGSYSGTSTSTYFLGSNLYMGTTECVFTLAKTEDGYTICYNGQYVYVNDSGCLAFSDTAAYWTFVSADTLNASRKTANLATLDAASKDNGVDATFLISNANFERNNQLFSTSWTVTANNNNLCGGNSDNHCAESWKSSNGLTLSQTLSDAPAGTYALTAQGFYRTDGTEAGALPYFFIGTATAVFPARTGTENSMDAASSSFSSGSYKIDPIYFYYNGTGDLTIGAKYGSADKWIIFDNFTLTYYGTENLVAAPPISAGAYYVQYAEESSTYYGKYMASGNNYGTQGIANDTGLDMTLETVAAAGTVTLKSRIINNGSNTTKQYLGSDLYMDMVACDLVVESTGDGTYSIRKDGQYLAINDSGVLAGSNTAKNWKFVTAAERIEALSAATESAPVNATFLMPGANFGRFDARVAESWTGTYTVGGNNPNFCAENYLKAFDLYQTVTSAPAGMYALTAQGFYTTGTSEDVPVFYIGDKTIAFSARSDDDEETVTDKATASTSFSSGNYTTGPLYYYYDGSEGGFKVGAKCDATDKWVVFDNFQLSYLGTRVATDADGSYYATIAAALTGVAAKDDKTVTIIAATDEAVSLPLGYKIVVSEGVDFTGTVTAADAANGVAVKQSGSTYEAIDNSSSTWTCTSETGVWSDAANWSTGVVPTQYTKAVFPKDATVFLTANAVCGEMEVDGTLKIAQNDWTVAEKVTYEVQVYGDVTGDEGTIELYRTGIRNSSGSSISFKPYLSVQLTTDANNTWYDSWIAGSPIDFDNGIWVGGRLVVWDTHTFDNVITLAANANLAAWSNLGFTFSGATIKVPSGTAYIYTGDANENEKAAKITGENGVSIEGAVQIDTTNAPEDGGTVIEAKVTFAAASTTVTFASGGSITSYDTTVSGTQVTHEGNVYSLVGTSVEVSSTTETTLVAVPSACKVNGLLDLSNRAAGDQLKAYSKTDKCYYAWTLATSGESLVWDATTVYVKNANGEQVAQESKPEASDYDLAAGEAVWITRTDTSKAIVFQATYSTDSSAEVTVSVDNGWNLIAPVPKVGETSFDVNTSITPLDATTGEETTFGDDDKIVIPTSAAPIPYFRDGGMWKMQQVKSITSDADWGAIIETENVEAAAIPSGTGFWFVTDTEKKLELK